jgi:hypothetical protein
MGNGPLDLHKDRRKSTGEEEKSFLFQFSIFSSDYYSSPPPPKWITPEEFPGRDRKIPDRLADRKTVLVEKREREKRGSNRIHSPHSDI